MIAIALAQLMLGADITIMNIALPATAQDLGLSELGRQWVVTAYALAYGSLLLLGGRIAQRIGYRRALLIGLGGFAAASLIGGLATSGAMLIAGRATQGVFGALMTPAALALLSTTFAPQERGRAFGIFSVVMGSSTAVGVLAGGLLTGYFDWRWAMFVNLPIAATATVMAVLAVRHQPTRHAPIDLTGALLVTTGLSGVVYGLSAAKTSGWSGAGTVVPLGLGIVLIGLFVLVESRRRDPLLPLRLLTHRPRVTAYLAMFSWGIALITAFLFLSFFLQDVLDYGPARTGLAFLPYPLAIQLGVRLVRRRMTELPVRVLLAPGLLLVATGWLLLSRLSVGADYFPDVVAVFVLLGTGTSLILPVSNSTATLGAGPDTAVAGALGSTLVQIGAGIGTAWLTTLAAAATASYGREHPGASGREAVAHGYTSTGLVTATTLGVAAIVVWFLAGSKRTGDVGAGSRGTGSGRPRSSE